MNIFSKFFGQTKITESEDQKMMKLDFIIMQGSQFIELSTYARVKSTCKTCGKDAEVITPMVKVINSIRAASVYNSAQLGTKGWKQLPEKTSKLAAYCNKCKDVFHLNCVKLSTMPGCTLFYCPQCNSLLGPKIGSINSPA